MDFFLTIDGIGVDLDNTWVTSPTIQNNVWLSLMVPKGAFFARPGFGSRFYELAREKNIERARALAVQYAKEALQWLIDLGKATAVEAQAERADRGVSLAVTVTQADGQVVTYTQFVEVG